ncbi:aspartyl-phosphate phosphatase Spo0E family protein [Lentibacillus cibarius]|uniref:Aspartyl-phosphate phosphatase Spo0E family protein n=1 Tax=Lentibacillus cibarius TaxID=2583219 RepID=A0A549YIL9_9BACI|nr:aspartyl-phosphate phosphatase Spo0E family protein [Lentibacillus cibarius]TMN22913.1 aspartyl-phosphate phosphatase Spo0E family protein [Lentibacillus cibarius]TRM11704.1 aspartyl-phosphate phosphatase Spo0E family protein [Lentibacillus cibarius]
MPALRIAISKKRKEMIKLGEKYGLADRRTIKCSQQLDVLLNMNIRRTQYLYKERTSRSYIDTSQEKEHIGA